MQIKEKSLGTYLNLFFAIMVMGSVCFSLAEGRAFLRICQEPGTLRQSSSLQQLRIRTTHMHPSRG